MECIRKTNRLKNDTTHACSSSEMLYVSNRYSGSLKHYIANLKLVIATPSCVLYAQYANIESVYTALKLYDSHFSLKNSSSQIQVMTSFMQMIAFTFWLAFSDIFCLRSEFSSQKIS